MNETKFTYGDKVKFVDGTAEHTITAVLRGAYCAGGVQGTAYQLDNKATTYDESLLVTLVRVEETGFGVE